MTLRGQTIWIIGASEGLGRELARQLDAEGARLILSARGLDRLTELAVSLHDATAIPMDVTDDASVASAYASAGKVDHVIYNAGAYDPMPATEWNTDKALRMIDVNFTGAMRVLGNLLPDMVARDSGEITLIGSLAVFRGLPHAIGYGVSKAALVHLGENLRLDLQDTGVTVRIANPGFIRTRLTAKNDFSMPMIMEPEVAAKHVLRAIKGRRFQTSFPAPFSWFFRLLPLMPDWLYRRAF